MDQTTTAPASNRKIIVVLVLLVIILGSSTGYLYKKTLSQQGNTEEAALAEAQSLASKVGKLIVLPTDEVPTIATVSDPEALKSQEFFTGTKNGDKVLIYTNAKKAILYDPAQNKIVNVAPLNIGDNQNSTSKHRTNAETFLSHSLLNVQHTYCWPLKAVCPSWSKNHQVAS